MSLGSSVDGTLWPASETTDFRARVDPAEADGWLYPANDYDFRARPYIGPYLIPAAPSGTVTGTAAITLDDAAIAGTATSTVLGTAAIALDDITVAGTGSPIVSANATVVLDDTVVAGTGSGVVTANAAIVLDDVTSVGAGEGVVSVSAAIVLDDAVVAGAGSSGVVGSAAIALDDTVVVGVGRTVVTASAAVALDDVSSAGAGEGVVSISAAIVLDDVDVAGVGGTGVVGSAAITLDDVVVVGVGNSTPVVVPVYTGPAITSPPLGSGGSGGGWGGSVPSMLRARLQDIEQRARPSPPSNIFAEETLGATPAPAPPPPPPAPTFVQAALAGAVGAFVVDKLQAEPAPAPNPAPARRARPELWPLAKGRPTGRCCFVCRERKPVTAFASNARRCVSCAEADAHRSFRCECMICGASFLSPSSRASLCSEDCRRARRGATP